jgi:hypothetical protein
MKKRMRGSCCTQWKWQVLRTHAHTFRTFSTGVREVHRRGEVHAAHAHITHIRCGTQRRMPPGQTYSEVLHFTAEHLQITKPPPINAHMHNGPVNEPIIINRPSTQKHTHMLLHTHTQAQQDHHTYTSTCRRLHTTRTSHIHTHTLGLRWCLRSSRRPEAPCSPAKTTLPGWPATAKVRAQCFLTVCVQ